MSAPGRSAAGGGLRVILAGTRSFGVAALHQTLSDGHDVAQVWAPADDRLTTVARGEGIEVVDTPKPSDAEKAAADLIVCAHSHSYVSARARSFTRLGGIGYHPSLLPRHRGRDAVRWTIHLGDRVAGGSVYWLTDSVDGGPLAAQDWCFVRPTDDASKLWKRELFPMGLRLLRRTLQDLGDGILVEVPQQEENATWEPSWERPPLHRPDLVQLGAGPSGFEVKTTRGAL